MKILIISNHAYPKQTPRAFRTSELAEQLVKMGHQVVVYSVTGKYDYSEYEKHTGVQMKNINPIFATSANDGFIRYNLFDKFMFHCFSRNLLWPQVEFHFLVEKIIKDNPNMDALITIAFPHSIHSGAARAKQHIPDIFPRVWISDCGDPFMLNPYCKRPDFMRKYEESWCNLTDYITVPTNSSIDGYYSQFHNKIRVIPQGFDFEKTPISKYVTNTVPTFVFVGTIYKGVRDPRKFMNYLLQYNKPYRFKLLIREALEPQYVTNSNNQIEYHIGLNRSEVIMECSKADFVINITNISSVQTPSKLIDYAIAKRPVLDIDNDFSDDSAFIQFMLGDYSNQHIIEGMDKYRIENVAQAFLNLMK